VADLDPGKPDQAVATEQLLPPRRVVLLGASNLVRGLPLVLDRARDAWGSPVDFLAAIGHGRSYGAESNVFGRVLPGILQCELWEALDQRRPGPTAGLVTDIGNDIVYGVSAREIADWVSTCLERLHPRCQRLVLTELPLASLERLGASRFVFLRTLLFPWSRISLAQALETARQLNRHVLELAAAFRAELIKPSPHWYGFDPIHIRGQQQREAWQRIFSAMRDGEFPPLAPHSFAGRIQLLVQRPLRRRLFGIEQRRAQPTLRLRDGSWLSLY